MRVAGNGIESSLLKIMSYGQVPRDCDLWPIGSCIVVPNGAGISHLPKDGLKCAIITLGWSLQRRLQICFALDSSKIITIRDYIDSWNQWL